VISLGVVAVGDLAEIDVKAANEELGRLAVDNL
jgi:hypothetical protein